MFVFKRKNPKNKGDEYNGDTSDPLPVIKFILSKQPINDAIGLPALNFNKLSQVEEFFLLNALKSIVLLVKGF